MPASASDATMSGRTSKSAKVGSGAAGDGASLVSIGASVTSVMDFFRSAGAQVRQRSGCGPIGGLRGRARTPWTPAPPNDVHSRSCRPGTVDAPRVPVRLAASWTTARRSRCRSPTPSPSTRRRSSTCSACSPTASSPPSSGWPSTPTSPRPCALKSAIGPAGGHRLRQLQDPGRAHALARDGPRGGDGARSSRRSTCFHERTAPTDWLEGLVKAYVGDGHRDRLLPRDRGLRRRRTPAA